MVKSRHEKSKHIGTVLGGGKCCRENKVGLSIEFLGGDGSVVGCLANLKQARKVSLGDNI